MPNYKYLAQNLNGKKVKGKRAAVDEQGLYSALKEDGLYLLSSKEIEEKRRKKVKLKSDRLADFCRQMGTLLRAGVSLVRALTIVSNEQGLRGDIHDTYREILILIRQGTALSEAMEEQNVFPPLLFHMIRSAEASGTVDETLLHMSEYYTKDHKMNNKIKNALLYPAILAGLLVVILIFIVGYIVPQFEDLFSQMGELPLSTRILLGSSDIFLKYWYIILVVVVLMVLGIRAIFNIDSVRMSIDRMKVRIPKMGKLMKTIYTARFARTLSSLYSSGISMISALQIGRSTIGNVYIEEQFEQVIAMVRRGDALSKALAQVDGFDQKLAATVLVGEETGSLNSMLDAISDALDHDADMAITKLIAMIEPAMIIIMGLVVGYIMIAVIQPIYGSYSAIEKSGGY